MWSRTIGVGVLDGLLVVLVKFDHVSMRVGYPTLQNMVGPASLYLGVKPLCFHGCGEFVDVPNLKTYVS